MTVVDVLVYHVNGGGCHSFQSLMQIYGLDTGLILLGGLPGPLGLLFLSAWLAWLVHLCTHLFTGSMTKTGCAWKMFFRVYAPHQPLLLHLRSWSLKMTAGRPGKTLVILLLYKALQSKLWNS